MPLGKVGLIFGAGGIAKSLVALGGFSVLGSQIPLEAAGASVFLTLEDDTAEVHRRIAALDPLGRRDGAPCFVIPALDLPGFDPALVTAEGRVAALTAFPIDGLDRLRTSVATETGRKVRLLVLDPAGDFLNANENDATFVKLLVRHLRSIAARHGCTISLLGHVANPTCRWMISGSDVIQSTSPPTCAQAAPTALVTAWCSIRVTSETPSMRSGTMKLPPPTAANGTAAASVFKALS
ncbi:AAA family ATPase [Roseomonas sp. HJA6]|uniref:AAA family ATPase n=2 Tax=Roseomonas alba TaxID=2846776 RepID=A0ABS7AGR8_9PROT|nr:AAA family ATPase [Neoroseomonas alba]